MYFSDRDARIAVALVVARMIHPSSEREALRWLETNSATLELLRLDTGQAIKLDKLYRLSDLLVKHHRAIEEPCLPASQAVRHWRRGDLL